MDKIKGFDIPFDLKQLKKSVNLIEQDGPLLSLYHNGSGDYYLLCWLDCDATANRWMILRVDLKSLCEYLDKKRTLLQIVQNPADNFVWITDIDNSGTQISTQALPVAHIPQDYLPQADSWFEFGNRQELMKDVSTRQFEVDVPQRDQGLFSALVSKMGWRLRPQSVRKLTGKVAL